jgi:hypothetical protein
MEKLNPWGIEVVFHERERIRLNIISEVTGEIRQITLNVDDIAAINILENQRIRKAAEIIDDDTENSKNLDELIGYIPEEPYEES